MAARTKQTTQTLSSLITPAAIKTLAGRQYFERGECYFQQGAVRSLAEYHETVTATVRGTATYQVRLQSGGTALDYSCTCPLGIDGLFCKHCVATALAWLDASKQGGVARLDDVEGIVMKLSKEELARILVEHAVKDKALRNRLLALAARDSGDDALRERYRKMIEDATEVEEYGNGYGYFGDDDFDDDDTGHIGDLVTTLNDLLRNKRQAPLVMELALYAIERVERGMEYSDDEAGYFDVILGDLADLHLRACRAAKPDQTALAARLFELEMADEYGTFTGTYATYADVLGAKGREHFRTLAQHVWNKLKPLDSKGKRLHDAGRTRITPIMESIARTSGTVEELVAVLSKDLSNSHQYARIAEAYHGARKHDLALQWAEKGLHDFPRKTDSRLLDFLIEEYGRRKMTGKMMEICWQRFTERRSLETYSALLKRAPNATEKKMWQARALELLRTEAAAPKRRRNDVWDMPDYASELLIEIHLHEKQYDDAWNTALEFDCSEDLWLRLAALRAEQHPEDALAVYNAQIEKRLPHAGRYERIIELLKMVQPLMKRLGRSDEFNTHIIELRTTWKRRRSFIALLENAFGKGK